MTPGQAESFNRMREALRSIRDDYLSPEKIKATSFEEYGLEPEIAIEYAYDNIQEIARQAVRGVRPVSNRSNDF